MKLVECLLKLRGKICLLFLAISCSGKDATQPYDVTPVAGGIKQEMNKLEVKTGVNCGAMSDKSCLSSDICILDQDENKRYYCRMAKDACETGFIQQADNVKSYCKGKKIVPLKLQFVFVPLGWFVFAAVVNRQSAR